MSDHRAGLQGRGLSCRRGRRLLFSGLDLHLPPGGITWLRGANGSGKTSLMRLLAGLAQPEAGEVRWNGADTRRPREAWQAELLYIGHANALKEDLTLAEALAFLAELQGEARLARQRATAALQALGVAHRANALVRTLSQGQRRRGALARLALDDAPRCWILDEPYDALDREGVARLDELITGHAARGGAVLLTSHQAVSLPGMAVFELQARADAGPAR